MADVRVGPPRVVLRKAAKREILNSRGTVAAVGRAAGRICSAANSLARTRGARYATDDGRAGRQRAHGIVHTDNYASMVDQHEHHTLNLSVGR